MWCWINCASLIYCYLISYRKQDFIKYFGSLSFFQCSLIIILLYYNNSLQYLQTLMKTLVSCLLMPFMSARRTGAHTGLAAPKDKNRAGLRSFHSQRRVKKIGRSLVLSLHSLVAFAPNGLQQANSGAAAAAPASSQSVIHPVEAAEVRSQPIGHCHQAPPSILVPGS